MEFIIKKFGELTICELYNIYKLRNEVFIVEQNCPYQDIDENDKVSVHVIMTENGKTIGYLRVLPAGASCENVAIGRVISVDRRKGNGTLLLRKGIEKAVDYFKPDIIEVDAQCYAQGLYEKCGFVAVSDTYLEDNIPHVRMELRL